jgi:hypothetical protein
VDPVHSCLLALGTKIPRLRSKSKVNSRKSAHNALAKVNELSSLKSKAETMKAKHLSLAIAALLAAGGLWLARSAWRTHTLSKSSTGVGFEAPDGAPKLGQTPRPPDPTQRFRDFTPEQRVEFARKGHGPGG